MPWRGCLLVVAVAVAPTAATACTGSSRSVDPGQTSTDVQSAPETGTSGQTLLIPPPPPLTHKQFVRRLDRLCKVGNRLTERKFGGDVDISDTAESMDAYARLVSRSNRFVQRWRHKTGFFRLNPGDPTDVRNYERYKVLTRRLRNFSIRDQRAAREHDFDELVRLSEIENRTRNQRTNLTADMGLRFCGA
jgi:hypothetical protein